MNRCDVGFRVGVVVAAASMVVAGSAQAGVLPATDGTAPWGNSYGLGYAAGDLYLHTGNSIHLVDDADREAIGFELRVTGLEDAFPGERRWFEGGFATTPNGQAMVSMGLSRGVLRVDLTAGTAQPVPAFDDENIYSLAGAGGGHFYAMWADPDWVAPTSFTRVYHVGPDDERTFAFDPTEGDFSGPMAFGGQGDLIIATFASRGDGTPLGTNRFFRVAAAELEAFEAGSAGPEVELIGELEDVNGASSLIVDRDGVIFFNTTTGIGTFDPLTGEGGAFRGDIADLGLWDYEHTPFDALAYDASRHELVYAVHEADAQAYRLTYTVIPEPTGAAMMVAAAGLVMLRRRGGG